MRIIVIDPAKRAIEERQLDPIRDEIDQIRDIIGASFATAFRFRTARGIDVCYVDDEGLLKPNDYWSAPGWSPESYSHAGIGVIAGEEILVGVGDDDEIDSETQPANVSLDEVKQRVVWTVPKVENT